MIELNKDKIQVRYITGINRSLPDYPTPLDVLYDSCVESIDGNLFSSAKMENKYEIDEKRVLLITDTLLDMGYIEKSNSRYKIINSPWH